jgi:erythromycin esterase
MHMRLRVLLWMLAWGGVGTAQVQRLDWDKPYDAGKLAFLKSSIGDRTMVQLGESIHLTDEFPRARLPIVRYLHEEMGFDVLAMEGSEVDTWLAQDSLYKSSDAMPKKALDAQRMAWFGIWQTEAMTEVMKYVAGTMETARPLYLTSFDIQPGSGYGFRSNGMNALDRFFKAVSAYAPPPDGEAFARWSAAFQPFLDRCYVATAARTEPQRKAMDEALAELSVWLRGASSQVRPAVHGRALYAVIASLRGTFELCGVAPTHPFGAQSYQRERDRENALNALTIQNQVSQSGKVILWAHHSHVNQGTLGNNVPSMGQSLAETLGKRLYTIGLFAEDGEAMPSQNVRSMTAKALPTVSGFEVEGALGKLAAFDYFLDLSSPSLPEVVHRAATTRVETEGARKFVLDRDFSAAIVVHRVHPPVFTFSVGNGKKND